MSKNIWVISDTHFNHANILTFTSSDGTPIRGHRFESVSDMDNHMIYAWNSVVNPGDKVYHLGDVVIGDREGWMKSNWSKLNGKKVLIVGNHDDIKMMARGSFFSSVYESRDLREFGLLLTHRPAHTSQLWDYNRDRPMKNIHGHIHEKPNPSLDHVNVSVEAVNYTPVNIEELRLYK